MLISHGTNKDWFQPWRRGMVTVWPLLTHGLALNSSGGPLLGLNSVFYTPVSPDWGFALTNVSHLWDGMNSHGARQGLWLCSPCESGASLRTGDKGQNQAQSISSTSGAGIQVSPKVGGQKLEDTRESSISE